MNKRVFPLKKLVIGTILTMITLSFLRIHVLREHEFQVKVVPQLPTCKPNMSASTIHLLRSAPDHLNPTIIDWPECMLEYCPEVVEHFTLFPYFNDFKTGFPSMTSLFAAHSVCSMKIANQVALASNSSLYIHAGAHLGALLHGGPIPWDDDVDMFLKYDDQTEFLEACESLKDFLPGQNVTIICYKRSNSIKLNIQSPQSFKIHTVYQTPYVDIFHFKMDNNIIYEVSPDGNKVNSIGFSQDIYFPIKKFYFAGIMLAGPQDVISTKRYNMKICRIAHYNHRLELHFSHVVDHVTGTKISHSQFDVDCCYMANRFPFVYKINDTSLIYNGNNVRYLDNSFS